MLKVILSSAFILSLYTFNAQAQYQVYNTDDLTSKIRMKTGGTNPGKVAYEAIKGTPYIFPKFKPATITTLKDEIVNLPVRYDLYTNEMEVKNDSRIFAIMQPEIIKMITTDSLKFVYSSFLVKNKKDHSFFILQSEGNCRLLVKKELRLQDPEKPGLYKDAKPAEFIFLKDSYYLKIGENDAVRIYSKDDVLSVMSDKAEQVSIFIRENRINLNKVEDLQKLVTYYNGLGI